MRSWFRRLTLGTAALVCAGFVLGAQVARWAERADTDDVTGSIGPAATRDVQAAAISLEERAQIFDSVMRIPDAPVADVEPPEPTQALPRSVALQDLPPGVA